MLNNLSSPFICKVSRKTKDQAKKILKVTQITTMKYHLKPTSPPFTVLKTPRWVLMAKLRTMALTRTCPSSANLNRKSRIRRILTVMIATTLNFKGVGAASHNLWPCGDQDSKLLKSRKRARVKAHQNTVAAAHLRQTVLRSTTGLKYPKLTIQKRLRRPQSQSNCSMKLNRLRRSTKFRKTFKQVLRKNWKLIWSMNQK